MSDEREAKANHSFGLVEVREIECLLWGYGQYVQRLPSSERNALRIGAVESLSRRLNAQLAGNDVQTLLNEEEVELLLEAMQEFGLLLKSLSPRDAERDSVIEAVESWQRRLTGMIIASDAT